MAAVGEAIVLLTFIFLFFRKDFLHDYELSHDAIPASRSDDNRRADGGHSNLLPSNMSCPLGIFSIMADVCEAFCFFRVFCGQMTDIGVHRCPFVVHNEWLVVMAEWIGADTR